MGSNGLIVSEPGTEIVAKPQDKTEMRSARTHRIFTYRLIGLALLLVDLPISALISDTRIGLKLIPVLFPICIVYVCLHFEFDWSVLLIVGVSCV